MAARITVEELAIDDTFINYCYGSNKADIIYWQHYSINNPGEADTIAEAREFVLALRAMLHEQKSNNEVQKTSLFPYKKMLKRIVVAAAAILIGVAVISAIWTMTTANKNESSIAVNKAKVKEFEKVFTTAKGEKKVILLPDQSKITLNAGSELKLDKDFGKTDRTVFLSGEALIEVVHNEALPFIVQTEKYHVKDLGTVFNVKAYPQEKTSETSLIKGSVEIYMKGNSRKIKLAPFQKIIIQNRKTTNLTNHQPLPAADVKVLPVSIHNSSDSAITETAWSQNRLEIVDSRFADMKGDLERWYNINIVFADNATADYRFTATFKLETIEEALKALQYSYHFTFHIQGNTITISK